MNRFIIFALLVVLTVYALFTAGCTRQEKKSSSKLQVVTTLFPLYDFARIIAGERGEVTMLLPPGMEPHSFEPKPGDIIRISKAGLFIYTNRYMEPWAASVLKGIEQGRMRVVDAGQGISYQRASAADEHGHAGHDTHVGVMDPHIWLDFSNADLMVDTILAGFVAADPANESYYREHAIGLKGELSALDRRYREGLASCTTRNLLHGGHFTFGYLAQRYGLEYHSLSGLSSESEPSAATMTAMVRQIRASGVHYLFAEELLSPRLTETLAAEAGVAVLKLHGAHNLGKDDVHRGVGFIGLMEQNLINLQKGLACQSK